MPEGPTRGLRESHFVHRAAEMKNHPAIFLALVLFTATVWCPACVSQKINKDTIDKIEQFIKSEVANVLEKDYRAHNIDIKVIVTDLKIDSSSKSETAQDTVYIALGRVSYIIRGKRKWKDQYGNIIQLDPEAEITHWYTCGVLEDKYMHVFFKDDSHRLTFYANKPTQGDLQ